MQLWLDLLLILMWLFVTFCLLPIILPTSRVQLWLNRPVRAFIAARRFKVPYKYTYVVLFISDQMERGTLEEEEAKQKALFLLRRCPERYQHSMEQFERIFLR
jgi:hypothetical protein